MLRDGKAIRDSERNLISPVDLHLSALEVDIFVDKVEIELCWRTRIELLGKHNARDRSKCNLAWLKDKAGGIFAIVDVVGQKENESRRARGEANYIALVLPCLLKRIKK